METKKVEDLDKGRLIKARILGRRNSANGKYRVGKLGLEEDMVKIKDIFFLETLEMRADLADKMIAEAESQGKDTTDPNVMKELGKEINAMGTPLYRREIIVSAFFFAPLYLAILFGIATGIWGLAFKKSILSFAFYGALASLLISLLIVTPVIAKHRTREQILDVFAGFGLLWWPLAIIIGSLGLIAWIIRLIFF